MMWRSFLYSPCTSLTTCTTPFGNESEARRAAASASARFAVGYCAARACSSVISAASKLAAIDHLE